MDISSLSVIGAAISIAITGAAAAIAQGRVATSALDGIARQPEASGPIGTNLILGLAFIESIAIYALVISLILIFANPFTKTSQSLEESKAKLEMIQIETQAIEAQSRLDALKQARPQAETAK